LNFNFSEEIDTNITDSHFIEGYQKTLYTLV